MDWQHLHSRGAGRLRATWSLAELLALTFGAGGATEPIRKDAPRPSPGRKGAPDRPSAPGRPAVRIVVSRDALPGVAFPKAVQAVTLPGANVLGRA